jgi:hypothetical protein
MEAEEGLVITDLASIMRHKACKSDDLSQHHRLNCRPLPKAEIVAERACMSVLWVIPSQTTRTFIVPKALWTPQRELKCFNSISARTLVEISGSLLMLSEAMDADIPP